MDRAFNKVIKSHITLAVLTVFAVVLMSAGVTYSLFQIDKRNKENQVITIGTLNASATSGSESIILNDLYPESASKITEDDKKFTFTIANDGTYDVKYTVYMKEVTDTFLATHTGYENYTKLTEDYYRYINYRLDGDSDKITSMSLSKDGEKYIVMKGILKAGTSEDHYVQFFLDNKDTTTEGAPNDINGSIISLDIHFEAEAYDENYEVTASEETLNYLKITANENNPNFANPATTNEGVYAMEDDYGTSYYYRGAVDNNYLKFGQNTSGEDMWWRIIRVNGDGSVRVQYDGAGAAGGTTYTRGFTHTSKAYNAQYNDAKYVGWMYGPSGTTASASKEQAQTNTADSDIKKLVDAWYKETIADKGLGGNVADVIFCNDRSTPGSTATGWSSDTGLGYGTQATAYGATSRTNVFNTDTSRVQPQFKCPEKNDAFTVDEEKGNGSLIYPVGLITADEIVAAGSGKYNTANSSYYLAKGTWYWSLSPCYFHESYAPVSIVGSDGNLSNYSINGGGAISPVINLKPEYVKTMIGTGTSIDPYRSE